MKSNLNKIKLYWLRLSEREKLSITLTFFLIVFISWNEVFFKEIHKKNEKLKNNLVHEKNIIKEIDRKIASQQARLLIDQDEENKNLLKRYTKQTEWLDKKLKEATVQIMPIKDMVLMIKDILVSQTKIEFVSLENKPAVALYNYNKKNQSSKSPGIVFYRHSVVLKMKGSYQSIFEYLKILEKMPWNFFWHEMDIEVTHYPEVFVTLELYTLGFGEGVLGV